MFSDDIQQLREALIAVGVPEDAPRMKAYMKGQFEYIGVKSKSRKEVAKPYIKEWLKTKRLEKKLVLELWAQEEREMQYIAMDYLARTKRFWEKEDLSFFKGLIQDKSWWDTVDFLASHAIGGLVMRFPEYKELMRSWNASDDMWIVRTSIIFQLQFKGETDMELLEEFVLAHKDSKEFFIQKASGWALRQSARRFPEQVRQFVGAHELPKLTEREAMKHLLE